MIRFENIVVNGWEATIRGVRNPLNSWHKSDSGYADDGSFRVGPADLKLMQILRGGGPDHGKFMRMISVTLDITAMQPWWYEFDTYKVGTVRNSCSKMHRIHVKPFEESDFAILGISKVPYAYSAFGGLLKVLEQLRQDFNRTNDRKYWRALIELLPEGYEMRATVMLNYEVLRAMYHARNAHKLVEWHDFCDMVLTLPYARELIVGGGV